jgi:transcriptional regulator with XRE-family HTH domain
MRQKRGTPGHTALLKALIEGRIGSGLTQVELAEKLKVRQSYVSNYETGERRLDVVEFILVCGALGLDPAGVVEEVAEVVAASPPKVLRSKAGPAKAQAAKSRKGPRKRKA